ncbi:MAG TPA: OsmC family peroxiredoxin [Tichowtungia sp.]|nr:OsmC family peroxiredoxin [Tichowtungia sp.]
MIHKKATAEWSGNLSGGKGSFSYGKERPVTQPYSFNSRFEDENGTGPEDLIAAAHAACYSMALSHLLNEEGFHPERVLTAADVSLAENGEGPSVRSSHLHTTVLCPEMEKPVLDKLASAAAENCPVSKALAGVDISVEAELMDSRGELGV